MTDPQDIFSSIPKPKTGPALYAILTDYSAGDNYSSKVARDLGWALAFVTDKTRAELCKRVMPVPLSLAKRLFKPQVIKGGYRAGSEVYEEAPRHLWKRRSAREDIGDHEDWHLDSMENLAMLILAKGKISGQGVL